MPYKSQNAREQTGQSSNQLRMDSESAVTLPLQDVIQKRIERWERIVERDRADGNAEMIRSSFMVILELFELGRFMGCELRLARRIPPPPTVYP